MEDGPECVSTHLAVPHFGILKRISLQDATKCSDSILRLVPSIFRKTPVKVLLDVFEARAVLALDFFDELIVQTRIRIPEVERTG